LGKGWAKKQPLKKVGPKNNLLGKGWAKKQPFGKRLGQKYGKKTTLIYSKYIFFISFSSFYFFKFLFL